MLNPQKLEPTQIEMNRFQNSLFLACFLFVVWVNNAQAQIGTNNQQGQSAFGNSGGQGAGGSAFAGQGAGGQNFGPGSFNNPQQRRFNQQQLGNRGQSNQRRFIGGSADEMQQRMREFSGGQRRTQFFDFQIENLNEQRRSEAGRGGGNQDRPPVRVQLRPRFNYAKLPASTVSSNVSTSLTRILSQRDVSMPQVELVDRTATLRGFVTSVEERDLIAKLVSLEPGISSVENLLEVETPAELISPGER